MPDPPAVIVPLPILGVTGMRRKVMRDAPTSHTANNALERPQIADSASPRWWKASGSNANRAVARLDATSRQSCRDASGERCPSRPRMATTTAANPAIATAMSATIVSASDSEPSVGSPVAA